MTEPGEASGAADGPAPREALDQPADHAREIEAVERAARRLGAPLSPADLADELIRVLEETLGYEYAAILVLDRDGNLVPYALSDQGRGPDFAAADRARIRGLGLTTEQGITGWVAGHGRPVRLGDVRDDPRYLAVRDDIRSELCVPLQSAGSTLGVVNIESTTADRYTALDERVLTIVAAQMAAAIRNAELRERIRHDQERLRHLERMEAAAQLASGVVHDFRGLLTAIRGTAELAREGLADDDALAAPLDAIVETSDRGEALTAQLMDLSRSTSLRLRPTDLNALVTGLRDLLVRIAGPGVVVSTALDPDRPTAIADPRALDRVLTNLVANARDALDGPGHIAVETIVVDVADEVIATPGPLDPVRLEAGRYVGIDVRDDGAGMDAETLRLALDPFYSTKGTGRGTGLGLAIVDGIVSRSDGEVVLASTPGRGTTVRILLPAAPAEPSDPPPASAPATA